MTLVWNYAGQECTCFGVRNTRTGALDTILLSDVPRIMARLKEFGPVMQVTMVMANGERVALGWTREAHERAGLDG